MTSNLMKTFERLVLQYLKTVIPKCFDSHQFAYRTNRCVEDAVSLTLHRVFEHLDTRSPNYARILFADFSSAFNTILPSKLIFKLKQLGVNYDVCKWIFSFLSDRPQVVRIGDNNLSKSLVINTGAPQGCVLSPQLYSLFTHDCISLFSDCVVTKFADDTTVAGLISQGNEEHYREQVNTLVR